jgi:hypothetical protein
VLKQERRPSRKDLQELRGQVVQTDTVIRGSMCLGSVALERQSCIESHTELFR